MKKQLGPSKDSDTLRIDSFVGRVKGMHVYVGNFTYVTDFLIVEDILPVIDDSLSQVLIGKPFIEVSKMTYDPSLGIVRFTGETDDVSYQMPYHIEQFCLIPKLEKEQKQSLYYRNDKDREKGVGYVMDKIIGFNKECLQLGLE